MNTDMLNLNAKVSENGKNINIPLSELRKDIPHLTGGQMRELMGFFNRLFALVRLVKPSVCAQYLYEDGTLEKKELKCYCKWGKDRRCENCISAIAERNGASETKIEFLNDRLYSISAAPMVVDGENFVLELATFVDCGDGISETEKNEIWGAIKRHAGRLYRDPVTGVYNRHYFNDKLSGLKGNFSFAMLDIDNFKNINDIYGHMAGDAALVAAAQTVKEIIGEKGAVIRYGGDEFFLLFNNVKKDETEEIFSEILRAVRKIKLKNYPEINLTVSIGGASGQGKMSQILQNADLALYEAKNTKDTYKIFAG